MIEVVIGLDIGTTSVKACVFSISGECLHVEEEFIHTNYPKSEWVEQDPDEVLHKSQMVLTNTLTNGCQGRKVISVGFSSAMHSIICVDQEGNALSQALIWADGRSLPQVEKFTRDKKQTIFQRTGTPVHPMSPYMKLLWMKENQYEPYLTSAYVMSIKEYVIYHWFQTRLIDFSMASATGLFQPGLLQWDQELLQELDIKEDQLSFPVPPTTILPNMNERVAAAIGIAPDTIFVIGAADGQLANLGIGAILPGEIGISVGTSGAVRAFVHEVDLPVDPTTFCYAFSEQLYIVGGPTNNGGIVLQWLKQLWKDERAYDEFLDEAKEVTMGSDGLLFLPYINGERAPFWKQEMKGQFHGVSIVHQQKHFIRAALEGMTYHLRLIHESLPLKGEKPERLYVNGGLARSRLWLQMLADVFACEVSVSDTHHSAAWGAAWTALVATGRVESFVDIKQFIPMKAPIPPNAENSQHYQTLYQTFKETVQRHI